MQIDIELPCVLVVCGEPGCHPGAHARCGEVTMAAAFSGADEVAYEAWRLAAHAWLPAPEAFTSVAQALRFVAGPHEHVVVSRARWTAGTATQVGRLLGEGARAALLRVARDQGWPLHGQSVPDVSMVLGPQRRPPGACA